MLIPFDQLAKRYDFKPKGVLHIGAHYGQEAEAYHRIGIDKMIFIEAIPDVYLILKENISRYPNATALNFCISDVDDQEVKFNIANNEGQSSSFLDFGTHETAHPEVKFINHLTLKTNRIDSLGLNLDGVDFLNIDLQGAELKALKGMGDLLKNFKFAYIEVNQAELYKGCPHVNDIDLFMNGFGFKRVETKWCGNFGWGDAFYIKK